MCASLFHLQPDQFACHQRPFNPSRCDQSIAEISLSNFFRHTMIYNVYIFIYLVPCFFSFEMLHSNHSSTWWPLYTKNFTFSWNCFQWFHWIVSTGFEPKKEPFHDHFLLKIHWGHGYVMLVMLDNFEMCDDYFKKIRNWYTEIHSSYYM